MIVTLILLTIFIIVLINIIFSSNSFSPNSNEKILKEDKYSMKLRIITIVALIAICSFCLYQYDCRKNLEKQQDEYCNELIRQQKELLKQEAKKKEEELQQTLNNNFWDKSYEQMEAEREQRELENRKIIEEYKREQAKIDEGAVPVPFTMETNRKSIYEEMDAVCRIPYSNTEVFKYSLKRLGGTK